MTKKLNNIANIFKHHLVKGLKIVNTTANITTVCGRLNLDQSIKLCNQAKQNNQTTML